MTFLEKLPTMKLSAKSFKNAPNKEFHVESLEDFIYFLIKSSFEQKSPDSENWPDDFIS